MSKKKTEYTLITQEQFSNMRAAILEYQQMHSNAQPNCGCAACLYAEKANIPTAQTYAPIFVPYDIPWHEEEQP